jgi:hypothetical protein
MVAGGSVHGAEDGVRVERGGRAVDWRAWRGEPSKQGQCARTPELVGIHPVSCPKAMHAGFCQRGDVDF